jgi:hypothetical protein
VVGQKHKNLGAPVENSFYYNNVFVKQCFARFATYEDFIKSNLVEPLFSNKEKFIIYCDDESLVKFFTAKIKSHIFNFDEVLFLELAKLFGVRLKIKSKLIDSSNKQIIRDLGDKFIALTNSSSVDKFPMSQYWTWENAGIEWKIANRKCGVPNNHIAIVTDLINRHVYSFFDEAKECYLSRKENGWATDAFNQKYFVEKEQFDKQLTKTNKDSTINAPIDSLLMGELMVNYILTEDLKDISQTRIFRAIDSTEIEIKYVKRQVISGFNLPYDIIISLSRPSYNLIAHMEYEKLELNEDLEINFVIPQKYEVCN